MKRLTILRWPISCSGLLAAGCWLLACSPTTSPWQLITAAGLPLSHQHAEAIVFLNESVGLLAGSEEPVAISALRSLDENQLAVVYRTTDGGRSWHKTPLEKGKRLTLATSAGSLAYLVRLDEHRPGTDADSSQVLCSADQGQTWQPLGTVAGQILELNFKNAQQGFAVVARPYHPERVLYRTTDGGRQWQLLPAKLPGTISRSLYAPDGTAWLLLTSAAATQAAQLAKLNEAAGTATVSPLPHPQTECFTSDESGTLWFASRAGKGITLAIRAARTAAYRDVHTFAEPGATLLAEAVHAAGPHISLLASTSNAKTALNHYRFYHSADAGKTWVAEELPVTYTVAPYCFYGATRAWLYALANRLQVR